MVKIHQDFICLKMNKDGCRTMKQVIQWLFMISLLAIVAGCSDKGSTTSSEQEDEKKEEVEHRIVSTTMSVTEILDALEIDGVIGVPTSTAEIPERYKDATKVGNPMSPDMELIKSLNPTEVFSVTTLKYDLEPGFRELNMNASFVNFQSIGEMQKAILDIGKRYDREEQAEALASKYDKKVEEIKAKVAGEKAPKVLALLGVPGSYLVATENSYIGDMISLIGAENAITGQSVEFLASNTEYLHQTNPDIILRIAHGLPDDVVEMFNKEFVTNDIWKHFSAVKNGRVYDLDNNLFDTTTDINADLALEELAKIVYQWD